MSNQTFKHVSMLWNDDQAAAFENDVVGQLVYRSNILGADLRLTNFGGGNTSCKAPATDPLTGEPVEVMWVKGSGGDLGSMRRDGLAALYLDRLRGLRVRYRGLEYEDEMVALFRNCLYDPDSKAPSIDTPLHGFLPFAHIDHLHPDAAIAIAAAKDGRRITEDLFEGTLGWVAWQRPGFDLGLKMLECLENNPGIRGIMLGSHGLFTWGETSHACYLNSLDVVEKCAAYIVGHEGKNRPVFGGAKIAAPDEPTRLRQAAALAPVLRGLCSNDGTHPMVGHFTQDERVMQFVNSHDLEKLAPMGTSCPDHFLRTKIAPLVLPLQPDADLSDVHALKKVLEPAFENYRNAYAGYYENCKHPDSPAMRDANPVILLWPGIGMFSFAKNKQTARVAAEFYTNAINVMRGAEAISEYTALPHQEAFNIEYWLLEEAKLQRLPKPGALSGRVALVTGSAGGIGLAVAEKLAAEGACVVLNDVNAERLNGAAAGFTKRFGNDACLATMLDVSDESSVSKALETACLAFGGIDIVVNNAGISLSKPLLDHTPADWDHVYNILVRGQFLVSRAAVAVMRKQAFGGDIVNIASKNAVVAGPDNAAYGSAKAAQAHLSRLLAAELGPDKIRVNAINPDAVIAGSNIWAGGWAEGRARAYGVSVEELPAFYAKRTLLNTIILPEDIANAVYALVGGLLNKSTGNTLNVDGGVAMGFLR